MQLSGKRWGIIGMGNIGKRVGKLATAFGCKVLYYKRNGDNSSQEFEGISLNKLLSSSRIISIHAPLNSETRNMIGKAEMALIKSGTILLNLGRGGIINEEDLAEAIDRHGILAGLDVFLNEPIEKTSPLLCLKTPHHLVMTPHIGFAAKEARESVIQETINNIEKYMNKIDA